MPVRRRPSRFPVRRTGVSSESVGEITPEGQEPVRALNLTEESERQPPPTEREPVPILEAQQTDIGWKQEPKEETTPYEFCLLS